MKTEAFAEAYGDVHLPFAHFTSCPFLFTGLAESDIMRRIGAPCTGLGFKFPIRATAVAGTSPWYEFRKENNMGIPYDLDTPDKVCKLPNKLLEVSGIYSIGKKRLVCVEDEHQRIYFFDLKKGEVYDHVGNGDKGDCEDIVILGKTAYVLLAEKCAIYEYKDFRASMKHPEKHPLKISEAYDPEGLGYDPKRKSLLVACKGSPHKKSPLRKVLRFDLRKGKCRPQLYFTIDGRKLRRRNSDKTFNPSGIAIHPKTRDIYMIGTKGLKLIVRLDKKGKRILGKKKLDKKIYTQPEGIAFSKKGDLFISSEGDEGSGKKAKIFRFKPLA